MQHCSPIINSSLIPMVIEQAFLISCNLPFRTLRRTFGHIMSSRVLASLRRHACPVPHTVSLPSSALPKSGQHVAYIPFRGLASTQTVSSSASTWKLGAGLVAVTGGLAYVSWQARRAWVDIDAHPYVGAIRLVAALANDKLGIDGVILKALKAFCDSPENRLLVIQNGGLAIALAILRASEWQPRLVTDVLDLLTLLCEDSLDNCAIVFSKLSIVQWHMLLSRCSGPLVQVLTRYLDSIVGDDAPQFAAKFPALCSSLGVTTVLNVLNERKDMNEKLLELCLRLATRSMDMSSLHDVVRSREVVDVVISTCVKWTDKNSAPFPVSGSVRVAGLRLLESTLLKLSQVPSSQSSESVAAQVLSADAAFALVRHLISAAQLSRTLPVQEAAVNWRPSEVPPVTTVATAPALTLPAISLPSLTSEKKGSPKVELDPTDPRIQQANTVAQSALTSLSLLLQFPHVHDSLVSGDTRTDGHAVRMLLDGVRSYVQGGHHSRVLDFGWSDVVCQLVKPRRGHSPDEDPYHLDYCTGVAEEARMSSEDNNNNSGTGNNVTTAVDTRDITPAQTAWNQYFEMAGDAPVIGLRPLKKQPPPPTYPDVRLCCEVAIDLLRSDEPDLRAKGIGILTSVASHSRARGVVLQDWLLHILKASVSTQPAEMKIIIEKLVIDGMPDFISRSLQRTWSRGQLPVKGPSVDVAGFQTNCVAACAFAAGHKESRQALLDNGLLTALYLFNDYFMSTLATKHPKAVLSSGVLCGKFCGVETLKGLEQTARCVANLAMAGQELSVATAGLGVLRTSKNPDADLLPSWLELLRLWSCSCDLGLRTQAGRALANLQARTADANATVNGAPMYEDMLWPIIGDLTVADAPASSGKGGVVPNNGVDVVLVHGLLGGPLVTWRNGYVEGEKPQLHEGTVVDLTTPVGLDGSRAVADAGTCSCPHGPWGSDADYTGVVNTPTYRAVLWPVSWLSKDLSRVGIPSRVVSVEYNGYILVGESPHLPKSLDELADELVIQLRAARIGVDRPAVFLTHSMGGLLTKKLIALANSPDSDKSSRFNVGGVVFFGVPHFGSPMAGTRDKQITWFSNLLAAPLLKDLSLNSPGLLDLDKRFCAAVEACNINVASFGESKVTPVAYKYSTMVVPLSSAKPQCGTFQAIDTDHICICKPSSRSDPLYTTVRDVVMQAATHHDEAVPK